MPRKNKFKPGPWIRGITALDEALRTGRWIYLFDRPKHPGFIISMRYRTIQQFIDRGWFRLAVPNKET